MKRMTKIQFDTIRRLALDYGHEWAVGLNFDYVYQSGGTVGEMWRRATNPATAFVDGHVPDADDLARCTTAAKWVALHDRIERGYVPTCTEIEELAEPLFGNSHFPTTAHVALDHSTCSWRTRWSVQEDGEVRFERLGNTIAALAKDQYAPIVLLARARVYSARNGARVAVVDAIVPVAQWSADDRKRFHDMLVSAGCNTREASRAIEATQFNGPKACHFDLAFCAGTPVAA
jgi:hypothetical protein